MEGNSKRQVEGQPRRILTDLIAMKNQAHILDGFKGSNCEAVAMVLRDMLSHMNDEGALVLAGPVTFEIQEPLCSFLNSIETRDDRERIWWLASCIRREDTGESILETAVRIEKAPKTLNRSGGRHVRAEYTFLPETTLTHIASLLHCLETLADPSLGRVEYEFGDAKLFTNHASIGNSKTYGIAAIAPIVVELSMKMLIDHHTRRAVPTGRNGHDLMLLWKLLDQEHREMIEKHYRNRLGKGSVEVAIEEHRSTYVWWRYPGETRNQRRFQPLESDVLRALAWATYAAAIAEYREEKGIGSD